MTIFLDYAARGRTRWWMYALTPVLALVLWMGGFVAVFIPLFVLRLVPADIGAWMMDPSRPTYFYGGTGLIFGALLGCFVIAIYLLHRKTFGDIIGRWRWRQAAIGGAIWLILCAATALIDYAVRPAGFRLTTGPTTLTLALFAIPSLAVQTFAEEFIFRGYVTQGLLLVARRPVVAAGLSAIIFASLHIPNGIPAAVNAVAFGFFTALIAIRTGGLAFTAGMHFVNNLFGALAVVSTSDVLRGSPGIFTETSTNLVWLDVASATVAFALVWLFVARGHAALQRPTEEA